MLLVLIISKLIISSCHFSYKQIYCNRTDSASQLSNENLSACMSKHTTDNVKRNDAQDVLLDY